MFEIEFVVWQTLNLRGDFKKTRGGWSLFLRIFFFTAKKEITLFFGACLRAQYFISIFLYEICKEMCEIYILFPYLFQLKIIFHTFLERIIWFKKTPAPPLVFWCPPPHILRCLINGGFSTPDKLTCICGFTEDMHNNTHFIDVIEKTAL